ncbi:MAG: YggS family pyridoxal phosphate-dependent enzyme [Chlorobiota bacterium]
MALLDKEQYKENYNSILNSIPEVKKNNLKIISVSKSHPKEAMKRAFDAGLRVFGENYVQEMVEKFEWLDDKTKDKIEWHFIGHLQTNKVKYIAPFVNCIHSVYKLKLAKEINKRANQNDRTIDILLQVNTSGEDSKSGCNPNDALDIAKGIIDLENVNLKGLMTISGLDSTDSERKKEFALLKDLKNNINNELGTDLNELSMGMTADYQLAISEGSTMIRVGTAIFGERVYS